MLNLGCSEPVKLTFFPFHPPGDDSFTSGVDVGVGERSFDGSNVACGERALSTEDETPTREQVCEGTLLSIVQVY